MEQIISAAALMADADCTRDERRERIVAECNAVRQALQDLLSEYMANVCFSIHFGRHNIFVKFLIRFFLINIMHEILLSLVVDCASTIFIGMNFIDKINSIPNDFAIASVRRC